MTYHSHASIIPLIGGEALASEKAFGVKPKFIMSYDVFKNNDAHLLNHYNNSVPYYVLDKGDNVNEYVDVVSSVCPCAGLSQLSNTHSATNPANDWMYKSTSYVLENVKPKVLWGENAPLFGTNAGKPVRDKLYEIAKQNGYTMTTYITKSLFHGVPQVRKRSFYFFWKGDRTPLLNYFNKELVPIEGLLSQTPNLGGELDKVTNVKIPTENPYYKYVLEEIHPGWSHQDFQQSLDVSVQILDYIEDKIDYVSLANYFLKKGNEKEYKKCMYRYEKLSSGGSIMKREPVIPAGYIGAFVGHMPVSVVHPLEDRFLTYRECMSIMGLPYEYELLEPKKNLNHVCQNVPFDTAYDMASEVKAVLDGKREWINATNVFQTNYKKQHEIWDENRSSLESFFE